MKKTILALFIASSFTTISHAYAGCSGAIADFLGSCSLDRDWDRVKDNVPVIKKLDKEASAAVRKSVKALYLVPDPVVKGMTLLVEKSLEVRNNPKNRFKSNLDPKPEKSQPYSDDDNFWEEFNPEVRMVSRTYKTIESFK